MAEMSVTSMTEYKMIWSRLGLMHFVGRIAGRWERGRDDGGVGGGVRGICGKDLESERRGNGDRADGGDGGDEDGGDGRWIGDRWFTVLYT